MRVAVAMPSASGFNDHRVTQSSMMVANQAGLAGIEIIAGSIPRVTVETARNWLTSEFLKIPDCDWCFWMDNDMVWPERSLVVMMDYATKLNAKFLSGVYYQRTCKTDHGQPCTDAHKPVLWRRDEVIEDADGQTIVRKYEDEYIHHTIVPTSKHPFIAHAVGFGCVLLHKSVVAAMKPPYFKFVDLGNGKQASEDFWFCVNARKLGFELWIIPEISCGHIGDAPIITAAHFNNKHEGMYKIKLPGAKPTGSAA